MTKKQSVIIILEKSDTLFHGRVIYQDNLIVASARTVDKITKKISKLLKEYHQLDPEKIDFEYRYDLTALFEVFSYLKISTVAEMAGINPSLLRQYSTGIKQPSELQAKKIETALRTIGKALSDISLSPSA